MLRCWSDENGFGVNERRTDKSRGTARLDKIGGVGIGSLGFRVVDEQREVL